MTTAKSKPRWPTLREIVFQLHWFVGIFAGSVLLLIGLSGALLAFREELLNVFNPGVFKVAVREEEALSPQAVLTRLREQTGEDVVMLTLSATPGDSVRAQLAPKAGERKGAIVYADPYTAQVLSEPRGTAFFEWVERLHRWLLLPRDAGRIVAGGLALLLLGLIVTGVYLRWPRKAMSPRSWLMINPRLKRRPFIWALHAVVGTWVLPVWRGLAATGIYWSFDSVRSTVDGWAGAQRAADTKKGKKVQTGTSPGVLPDISLAWHSFNTHAQAWTLASVRLPKEDAPTLDISWLAADAVHERARNRMRIDLQEGHVSQDERFNDQSAGKRALAAIYPLHMGSYFGLVGRIVVTLSALALPLLTITGYLLYLQRRRMRRRAEAQAAGLKGAAIDQDADSILVAYASQSGKAQGLALQTARALEQAGQRVMVASLAGYSLTELARYQQALFVASTYGEGGPPDAVRGFAQALSSAEVSLKHLKYALLALGNRQYCNFCGFGRALDDALQYHGALAVAPMIEICDSESAPLQYWFSSLKRFGADVSTPEIAAGYAYDEWEVVGHQLLNPGSQGSALYEIALQPTQTNVVPAWQAGSLVEVMPRQADADVAAWLVSQKLNAQAMVQYKGRSRYLVDALSESQFPDAVQAFVDEQACAHALNPLAARRYSVASIPQDGSLQLIVREHIHAKGIGLASGYLTQRCGLGSRIAIRLIENPAFALAKSDVPCIFIGNGSGLAGLRSLLRERVRCKQHRNWLIFGERNHQYDTLCAQEFEALCRAGSLTLDRIFSRDGNGPAYVQDRLREASTEVCQWVAQGAVIYVCGSLQGMARGVDEVLAEILTRQILDELTAQGRYRRDVY
ncbi:PepSY domain-containing protein [Uliginosibacterium gangwonense]|uniref:PepSY domain-containing protein n=1 Tax=Uliginosibacterium gangwonense TaxID=392736 RepID=UPI000371A0DD|nr:sulfite reductase flavoprotein subunit alpha [Uliginosibacterium gangwonense]